MILLSFCYLYSSPCVSYLFIYCSFSLCNLRSELTCNPIRFSFSSSLVCFISRNNSSHLRLLILALFHVSFSNLCKEGSLSSTILITFPFLFLPLPLPPNILVAYIHSSLSSFFSSSPLLRSLLISIYLHLSLSASLSPTD